MPIVVGETLALGSGVAGLSFALEAAQHGDVVLVTKRSRDESNTKYAQGGIAAVLDEDDSFDAHTKDTLIAGAGLCHERVVEMCVKEAPERIAMAQAIGARFARFERDMREDATPTSTCTLEGGTALAGSRTRRHDRARGGARAARGRRRPAAKIRILEEHMAIDLITLAKYGGPGDVRGRLRPRRRGRAGRDRARARDDARDRGGEGSSLYTTNPDVAISWRQGHADGLPGPGRDREHTEFYRIPSDLASSTPQAKNFLHQRARPGKGRSSGSSTAPRS